MEVGTSFQSVLTRKLKKNTLENCMDFLRLNWFKNIRCFTKIFEGAIYAVKHL